MSQKPSACRFVLYCFRDRRAGLVERPALVTSVDDVGGVNLHVFYEPHDSDECDREDPPTPYVPIVEENKTDEPQRNTWRWPPRSG